MSCPVQAQLLVCKHNFLYGNSIESSQKKRINFKIRTTKTCPVSELIKNNNRGQYQRNIKFISKTIRKIILAIDYLLPPTGNNIVYGYFTQKSPALYS
jgi:hypothetical protein